jgi:sortase (surface protein transpeptidase)
VSAGPVRGRRGLTVLAVIALVTGVVLVVAALGVFAASRCAGAEEARSGELAMQLDAVTNQARPTTVPRARVRHVARPTRIEIPSIGVDAAIIPLGLNRDRTLEVPEDFAQAGWWTGGARPGRAGPAIIAGHVDSHTGPAVFYRLRELRPGATIIVDRRDGTRARFTVLGSERYPKSRFPTARVYGSTPGPTLRLITCSGTFDGSTGHYLDNTVVYADAA